MKTRKTKRDPVSTYPRQPMFRPKHGYSQAVEPQPFFRTASGPAIQLSTLESPMIQRQETPEAKKPEEKDPVVEGLKTTGAQLLKNPKFKAWYEPKLDFLKKRLWEERPSDEKAALIAFGGVNLGLAGLVLALNPKIRDKLFLETLPGANVGAPLGWIPYSPIEGFKYQLPQAGQSSYGFSGEFTFNPYLELLRKRYPQMPLTGATFGLDTAYTPGQSLSLTGGRFGLDFFGGGLKAEGKSFTELSPYPTMIPGVEPFGTPSTLMQSVPGLPPIQTGPSFQFMLSIDLVKLGSKFPSFQGLF